MCFKWQFKYQIQEQDQEHIQEHIREHIKEHIKGHIQDHIQERIREQIKWHKEHRCAPEASEEPEAQLHGHGHVTRYCQSSMPCCCGTLMMATRDFALGRRVPL